MATRGEQTYYLKDSINEGADGPFIFMDAPIIVGLVTLKTHNALTHNSSDHQHRDTYQYPRIHMHLNLTQ
jgi:hypothetical protein